MGHLPSDVLVIFAVHLAIGVMCLYFGFRAKRPFRWLLLFVGGLEMIALSMFLVIALNPNGN